MPIRKVKEDFVTGGDRESSLLVSGLLLINLSIFPALLIIAGSSINSTESTFSC